MRKKVFFIFIISLLFFGALIIFNSIKNRKNVKIIKQVKNNKFIFEKRVKGKKKFSVIGDSFSISEDKYIHINGNVITDFFTGGKRVKVFSKKMVSSPDFKKIIFSHNVKVNTENISVEGEEIRYNQIVIRSKIPVKIKGKDFSFKAKRFFYRIDKDLLVFGDINNFFIKKDNSNYQIKAKNAFFYNKDKILKMVGTPLKIISSKDEKALLLSMPSIYLSLTKDNKLFDGFTKAIKIRETFISKDKKGKEEVTIIRNMILNKVRIFFENNNIALLISDKGGKGSIKKGNKIRKFLFSKAYIKFKKNKITKIFSFDISSRSFTKESKKLLRSHINYAEVSFSDSEKISKISLKDKSLFFLLEKDFNILGKEAFFNLDSKKYVIYKEASFYNKKGTFIKGEEISLDNQKKILKAKKNVSGFLNNGKTNFMCDKFYKKDKKVEFEGNVFIKNTDGEILGEKVIINGEKTVKILQGKIIKDDILMRGQLIDKTKNSIKIQKNIVFKKGENLKITGGSASIKIKNNKYYKVFIEEGIKIFFDKGKGYANKAEIDLEKKMVFLKGKARFEDKKGTKIEGEKLTLNLENGKIYATSKVNKKVKVIIKEE